MCHPTLAFPHRLPYSESSPTCLTLMSPWLNKKPYLLNCKSVYLYHLKQRRTSACGRHTSNQARLARTNATKGGFVVNFSLMEGRSKYWKNRFDERWTQISLHIDVEDVRHERTNFMRCETFTLKPRVYSASPTPPTPTTHAYLPRE